MRIDPQVLAEIRRWADDEMRSVNGQIEYLLRQSLQKAGRTPKPSSPEENADQSDSSGDC